MTENERIAYDLMQSMHNKHPILVFAAIALAVSLLDDRKRRKVVGIYQRALVVENKWTVGQVINNIKACIADEPVTPHGTAPGSSRSCGQEGAEVGGADRGGLAGNKGSG